MMPLCSICGRGWEDHYQPELLKYKSGPYGTFGLKEGDHAPHIAGVHAPRVFAQAVRVPRKVVSS